ncbi:MAG: hypothetical protein DRN37_01305 [Thermoplasmata archaeon]|nr:MAG: hypothetical protein DRG82_14270 [Deltaproteobacteria bacterium]RLF61273.1 MAG: hypothetical protein DRN37_01305 [Thermoplasmata archaeon]HDZ23698.1 hypothetical protein [Desulfobacteraceae bacterium]
MEAQLKKLYFSLLIPVIVGFIAAYAVKIFLEVDVSAIKSFRIIAPLLFVLAFAFGVALPILRRTLFVRENHDQKEIKEADLLKFERETLYIAMITPYICLVAFFLEISRFHFLGTVLATFYAVYYFYPSHKRIHYEKRIFRTK